MELCPYWPGDGCVSGMLPCADTETTVFAGLDPVSVIGADLEADAAIAFERAVTGQPGAPPPRFTGLFDDPEDECEGAP